MNILILGGTAFVGRHTVQAALERGHSVTLFNRGSRNPFPELETLIGNRDPNIDAGLSALEEAVKAGRRWDVVLDPSGYVPRIVGASARLLEPHVGRYVFISSISVYANVSEPGVDEHGELLTLEDPETEDIAPNYGGLKAACEHVVSTVYADRALNIRPGLIVGPFDPTDRFTYWPVRVARGGDILAPGTPETLTQFIDARDLAEWTVRLLEQGASGTFNATGQPVPMGRVLEACGGGHITWVSEEFLEAEQVPPWMGVNSLPLWIPRSNPGTGGFAEISIARALEHGLTFRALGTIAKETVAWASTRPDDHAWKSGLSPEREQELLAAWHHKNSATT